MFAILTDDLLDLRVSVKGRSVEPGQIYDCDNCGACGGCLCLPNPQCGYVSPLTGER